jgi:cell division protein FtsL
MQVPNKNYKDITKKRLVGWVLLVVVWVMILSVFKSFMQTRRGFERLDEAGKRLLEVQQENEALKVKLQEVSSDEYKTRIVREKLRMQKGDEVVVVMPEESTVMGLNAEKADKENWRKWLELLI